MRRIKVFLNMSMSRKLQYIGFLWNRLVTHFVYRYRLNTCGKGCTVASPLFWTPEFISLGNNVLIWPGFRIEGVASYAGDKYMPQIIIGDNVTIQQRLHVTAATRVEIGQGTTILFDVTITDIDHGYEKMGVAPYDQPINVHPTYIGRNCLISAGAKILAGTELGSHCVVGANAVVRGKYPEGSVLAGNPARVVKKYDFVSDCWIKP